MIHPDALEAGPYLNFRIDQKCVSEKSQPLTYDQAYSIMVM
jgi:hypothetical protein